MPSSIPRTGFRPLLGLGLLLTSLALWAADPPPSPRPVALSPPLVAPAPAPAPALIPTNTPTPALILTNTPALAQAPVPPPVATSAETTAETLPESTPETPPETLPESTPETTAERVYSFGVVPQQAATRLAQMWVPLLQRVQALSGVPLKFTTAKNIPSFEQGLAAGQYDFAYMNPYHFVVFNAAPGYRALARDRDQRLKGIMVVAKESPFVALEELANQELVFPAPGAFAASILTRAELEQRGIPFQARFVASHDSVYLNVAGGHFAAGGGIRRTLEALKPELQGQLRVLWETPGFTSHAIAVSPQVAARDAQAVGQALVALASAAPALLKDAALGPLTLAEDGDWDDIRALDVDRLRRLSQMPAPWPTGTGATNCHEGARHTPENERL